MPSSESNEKENQVPVSSTKSSSSVTETPLKRKAPQKPERISSNGSSETNITSTSSGKVLSASTSTKSDLEKLSVSREETQVDDEEVEKYRLPLHKHNRHQHHQQISVSLGDEDDDEEEGEGERDHRIHQQQDKSTSGNNFDEEIAIVDTSHVSIVTIDDNGKDVTIKTTSSNASHSPSRLDDLRAEASFRGSNNDNNEGRGRRIRQDFDEDYPESGRERRDVTHPSSSSRSHTRQLDSKRMVPVEEEYSNRRFNQESSADEVIVIRNSQDDVAKEVIIVSSEDSSRDQSYNRSQQFTSSSVEETKQSLHQQQQQRRLHQQYPHESDDRLSIKTESSESSSGYYPAQTDHIIMETRKKVPPAKNKESRSFVPPSIPPERLVSRDQSQEDIPSQKNGDRPLEVSSSPTPITKSSTLSSFANGIMSGFKSSSSSLPRNQRHAASGGNLHREASDAGSVGSFASCNSDRDSNVASCDATGSPMTGVILRRKVRFLLRVSISVREEEQQGRKESKF